MSIPVTYNFPGSSLGADWTEILNGFTVESNVASGNAADVCLAKWVTDTFSADQKASVIPDATAPGLRAGCAVRLTGTSAANARGYAAITDKTTVEGDTLLIWKVTDGSVTDLVAPRAVSPIFNGTTDILAVEIEGTTLRVKRNGTQIGADISATDYATGQPGIAAYADTLKSFTADNIGGAYAPPVLPFVRLQFQPA